MLEKKIPLAGFCLAFAVIFFSCAAAPKVKETSSSVDVPNIGASNAGNSSAGAIAAATGEINPQNPEIPWRNPRMPEIPKVIPPEIPPEGKISEAISSDLIPENPEEPVIWLIGSGNLQVTRPPVRPWRPAVPEYIMGKGLIHPEDMSAFLLGANPGVDREFVETLASIYTEETAIEGVNHDVAFAQMCLETGFLRYGGLVTPDMNNFCGLGAIGPGQTGARFPDSRTGVRAHIQHLKAYATEAPLKQELVDPRYHYVRYGSSPAIKGLAGTWAADLSYAEKINNILERLFNYVFED